MLGAYTFWDAMWTMIVFFIWVMFICWVIMLLIDNFRRTDHSGWAKTGWFLFIIFLPVLGAIVYTVARPDSANDYVRAKEGMTSGGTSTAEELAQLHQLHDAGAISDAEFEQLKHKTITSA